MTLLDPAQPLLLSSALTFASAGIPVFPTDRQKRPLTPHGLLDATTDRETITAWWTRWPNANVAIRTGQVSGLVVLDVDGPDGADSLFELEREHGALPTTTTAVTPRGGAHFFFRWPGVEARNSAGKLGPGLDVRGDGGYVLVAPSETDRGSYVWDERTQPQDVPEWLLRLILASQPSAGAATPPDVWVELLGGIRNGTRNESVTRLVGYLLRRYVHVDVAAALVHLVNEHCAEPPLPRADVDRIIDSIAKRELARRKERSR